MLTATAYFSETVSARVLSHTNEAGCCSYPDVWRRLHPEQTGVYTVWDEKTSARIFNEARS